jgi:hypothetical protein
VLVKQRVKTNIRVVATLVFAAVLLVVSSSSHSYAVDANNSPNTLKVSPVRSDISIAAGASDKVEVTITNLTSSPVTLQLVENDFIAGDERGTPALILDADKYAPTHSLKRFMKPMQNVTIPGNQSKLVDVEIDVPKDAQAGGYFGAIRFAPASPDGSAQVNLSTSVASLILLTVPGDIIEKMNLTDFSVQQNGKVDTMFQDGKNLELTFRFENKGSVQEAPFGKISVKRGSKVVYETDFNQEAPRDVVLPDSARRWDEALKNIDGFGEYEIHATLTYGTKNETVEATKKFWVVPVWVIIAASGGLVVLVLLIIGIWLGLRSYKRRILRSQGRNSGYRR